jgi:hypothetical protein
VADHVHDDEQKSSNCDQADKNSCVQSQLKDHDFFYGHKPIIGSYKVKHIPQETQFCHLQNPATPYPLIISTGSELNIESSFLALEGTPENKQSFTKYGTR